MHIKFIFIYLFFNFINLLLLFIDIYWTLQLSLIPSLFLSSPFKPPPSSPCLQFNQVIMSFSTF